MKPSWRDGVVAGCIVFSIFIVLVHSGNNAVAPVLNEQLDTDVSLPTASTVSASSAEIELPFRGREIFPNYRFVALYGSGEYSGLGALGEQSISKSVARVRKLADKYQKYSEETVIPTFEIITTVASAEPTENKDYSREIQPEKIKPWINAAHDNEMYVILDFQPGRSTFLSQLKVYEDLLLEPHVGVALDPEWRLQKKSDRHLVKVGTVSADEINEAGDWLADLVKENDLPQKMFIVHQFKTSMIIDRSKLNTSRGELAFSIHMDGHGTLSSKQETWRKIKNGLPENTYMAWKNFYDEDDPTPTPKQTMNQKPMPWFISYQ